jgi:hypothetical protein
MSRQFEINVQCALGLSVFEYRLYEYWVSVHEDSRNHRRSENRPRPIPFFSANFLAKLIEIGRIVKSRPDRFHQISLKLWTLVCTNYLHQVLLSWWRRVDIYTFNTSSAQLSCTQTWNRNMLQFVLINCTHHYLNFSYSTYRTLNSCTYKSLNWWRSVDTYTSTTRNFNLKETDFWQPMHQLFTVWATFTEVIIRIDEPTLTTLVWIWIVDGYSFIQWKVASRALTVIPSTSLIKQHAMEQKLCISNLQQRDYPYGYSCC